MWARESFSPLGLPFESRPFQFLRIVTICLPIWASLCGEKVLENLLLVLVVVSAQSLPWASLFRVTEVEFRSLYTSSQGAEYHDLSLRCGKLGHSSSLSMGLLKQCSKESVAETDCISTEWEILLLVTSCNFALIFHPQKYAAAAVLPAQKCLSISTLTVFGTEVANKQLLCGAAARHS